MEAKEVTHVEEGWKREGIRILRLMKTSVELSEGNPIKEIHPGTKGL